MSSSRRRWPTWLVRALAVLLLAFAALNVLAYRHAQAMLYFVEDGERTAPPEQLSTPRRAWTLLTGVRIPRPETARQPEIADLSCQEHTIPVDDGHVRLEGWNCGDRRDGPLVLLFHGYADEKSSLLEEAAALYYVFDASVLLVGFRGSGASSEAYTTVGVAEARDVAAAVDYAQDELSHADDTLVLFGRSMGAAAILRAVSELGVQADGYVLESVFDDLLNTVRHRFRAMGVPSFPSAELLVFSGGRQAGFDGFAHRPVTYAAEVDAPMLVLHGAEDPRVSVEQAQAVVGAALEAGSEDSRLHVIDGVGHEPLMAAGRDAWIEAVGELLELAEAKAVPPDTDRSATSVFFVEDGVVRSAPASNSIRLTSAQAERIALSAFPPRGEARVEETGLLPLGAVLSRWIEDDAWPMETRLPKSLRDVTGPMYSYEPLERLPNDPSMLVPHYIVRGTVFEPFFHPFNREYRTDLELRTDFHALVDSHDGSLRALQCGDSMMSGRGGRTTLAHESQHAPFVRLTPIPSQTPSRAPTPTPSIHTARRLLERYAPLEIAKAGPTLRRTLELLPLRPGTRWTYRTAGSSTGCTAWQSWEESIDVITVVDARLLSADLALFRLGHQQTAVKHGPRSGPALDARPASSSSHRPEFILVWRDEIYEPWNERQLREQLAYFERDPIPTAAPRKQYGAYPIERPFPILRLPLTSDMPPVPSEGGGDWTPPTPEPPWPGDPQQRPCATVYATYGSTAVWQTFCHGVGWSLEASYGTNSGRHRWWRELVDVRYGTPR